MAHAPATATPAPAGATSLPFDPPLHFTVDHVHYTLDGGTRWWLETLAAADWWTLIGTSLPADSLAARIMNPDDDWDASDAAQLAADLTRSCTGWPWPAAVRLAMCTVTNWTLVDGWALEHGGTDLLAAPPRRSLAAMWQMLRSTCEKPEQLQTLERDLHRPDGIPGPLRPGRAGAVAPWTAAEEAEGFLAGMAQLGALTGARSGGGA